MRNGLPLDWTDDAAPLRNQPGLFFWIIVYALITTAIILLALLTADDVLPAEDNSCDPAAAVQWYLHLPAGAEATMVDTVTGERLRALGLAYTEDHPDGTIAVKNYAGAVIAYRRGEPAVVVEAYRQEADGRVCRAAVSTIPVAAYLHVIHPELETAPVTAGVNELRPIKTIGENH